MTYKKEIEISNLKNELKYLERDKDRVGESYWFICGIFLPVVGGIILVISVISKLNKVSRLERECSEIREKIRELESELREEKYRNNP